jgi:hypothetical protein
MEGLQKAGGQRVGGDVGCLRRGLREWIGGADSEDKSEVQD